MTFTPVPTDTPTVTLTPTPTHTPTSLPAGVLLEPMNHQWQTLNNCGPASIAILLGYYGHQVTQHEVKEQLSNGFADVEHYVAQYQLTVRTYRTSRLSSPYKPVRRLLANDIPVIALQRLSTERNIGHFRVIRGYDDASGEFISDDPLIGEYMRIPYDTFARFSYSGNITAIYPADKDSLVQSLVKDLRMTELPPGG